MDSVSRLNGIISVLRRQIAESSRRDGPGSTSSSAATAGSTAARAGLPELRQKLRSRLRSIDVNDPDRAKKSQRVFLESVLAWEFGDRLLLDRRFDDMVDEIRDAVARDPAVNDELTRLLDALPDEADT